MKRICQFSVIQYVPDPQANERLNFGVVVLDGDDIKVKFLHDWKRLRRFSEGDDLGFLKDFAEHLEAVSLGLTPTAQLAMFEDVLRAQTPGEAYRWFVDHWHYSIQFTTPQPSLEEPEDLLEKVSHRYLKEAAAKLRLQPRTRNQLVNSTATTLRTAMKEMSAAPIVSELLQTKHQIPGRNFRSNTCDIAFMNGTPYSVAQTISFQTKDLRELELQSREAIASMIDLKLRWQDLPSTFIYAPPMKNADGYARALTLLDSCRYSADRAQINLVEDNETPGWARETVSRMTNVEGGLPLIKVAHKYSDTRVGAKAETPKLDLKRGK